MSAPSRRVQVAYLLGGNEIRGGTVKSSPDRHSYCSSSSSPFRFRAGLMIKRLAVAGVSACVGWETELGGAAQPHLPNLPPALGGRSGTLVPLNGPTAAAQAQACMSWLAGRTRAGRCGRAGQGRAGLGFPFGGSHSRTLKFNLQLATLNCNYTHPIPYQTDETDNPSLDVLLRTTPRCPHVIRTLTGRYRTHGVSGRELHEKKSQPRSATFSVNPSRRPIEPG